MSDSTKEISARDAIDSEPALTLSFSYPDANQNAETLMVNQQSGTIYVMTKHMNEASGIYQIQPSFGSENTQTAKKVGQLELPSIPKGFLTGGDISPDGRHVIVCDYLAGYEYTLPADSSNFDDIWKQVPAEIFLGDRQQGEAVAYGNDGNEIYATSEKRPTPVIELKRSELK